MGCNYHSAISNKNVVYLSGYNKYGQLGCKEDVYYNVVKFPYNIKQIICGNLYTFILLEDNSVYVSGYNNFGQLGVGDNINRYKFVKINTIKETIKQISCGYNHTVILLENGSIYVAGLNNYGQLGLNDIINRYVFIKNNNINNIKNILCSDYYTLLLNNTLECFFTGIVNELYFDQTFFNKSISFYKLPILEKIKLFTGNVTNMLFVTQKNDIISFGLNIYGSLSLNMFSLKENYKTTSINIDIKDIKSGLFHNVLLDRQNNMYVSGRNNNAQLGLNNIGDEYNISFFKKIHSNVKYISTGQCYTMFLTTDNYVYGFGNNKSKQLYLKTPLNILKAKKIKNNIQLLWV